jgi:hypothetical protein
MQCRSCSSDKAATHALPFDCLDTFLCYIALFYGLFGVVALLFV